MNKISQEERLILEELRNLSKLSIEDVNKCMKGLLMLGVMNYSEDEPIYLPYFGSFKIKYEGDEIVDGKRVAKLSSTFEPNEYFKLNIGVYEDIKSKGGDISNVPIIKMCTNDIENRLSDILENS